MDTKTRRAPAPKAREAHMSARAQAERDLNEFFAAVRKADVTAITLTAV